MKCKSHWPELNKNVRSLTFPFFVFSRIDGSSSKGLPGTTTSGIATVSCPALTSPRYCAGRSAGGGLMCISASSPKKQSETGVDEERARTRTSFNLSYACRLAWRRIAKRRDASSYTSGTLTKRRSERNGSSR